MASEPSADSSRIYSADSPPQSCNCQRKIRSAENVDFLPGPKRRKLSMASEPPLDRSCIPIFGRPRQLDNPQPSVRGTDRNPKVSMASEPSRDRSRSPSCDRPPQLDIRQLSGRDNDSSRQHPAILNGPYRIGSIRQHGSWRVVANAIHPDQLPVSDNTGTRGADSVTSPAKDHCDKRERRSSWILYPRPRSSEKISEHMKEVYRYANRFQEYHTCRSLRDKLTHSSPKLRNRLNKDIARHAAFLGMYDGVHRDDDLHWLRCGMSS